MLRSRSYPCPDGGISGASEKSQGSRGTVQADTGVDNNKSSP